MGEEQEFYYNFEDFYISSERVLWDLSLYHPFHATIIACFFAGTILVPLLYALIYRWLMSYDCHGHVPSIPS